MLFRAEHLGGALFGLEYTLVTMDVFTVQDGPKVLSSQALYR